MNYMSRAVDRRSILLPDRRNFPVGGETPGWIEATVRIGAFVFLAAAVVGAGIFVSLPIAFVTFFVMLASYALLRETTDFRYLTIMGFWFFCFMVQIFFPGLYVYSDNPGLYRDRYLFAFYSVLITVPLGAIFAATLFRCRRDEMKIFLQKPLERWVPATIVFVFFLTIAIGFTANYIREVGLAKIPLFYLIKHPGAAKEVANMREDSLKTLNSPFRYEYNVVRGVLYPFLLAASYGALKISQARVWRVLFVGTFCLALFYCSLMTAKEPVAALFVVLTFFVYYNRKGDINIRAIMIGSLLVLAFPIVIIVMKAWGTSASEHWYDPLTGIGNRMFYVPAYVLYLFFEIFPHRIHYLHGASIGLLSTIMGWQFADTPNLVARIGFPEGLNTMSANAGFIADMNADFGMWGVILSGILTGFLMQGVHTLILRQRKTTTAMACYAFMLLAFWQVNLTALPVVLGSAGVVFTLLMAWCFEQTAEIVPVQVSKPRLQRPVLRPLGRGRI